ncbi:hypothetical protein KPL70_021959 [Citrus sinensis]|nr:hypothetical protein KPL70_021959 [Citrus sinensis]
MRSDRCEEFTSKEFLEFCEANGIRCPLTVPRSPQQNDIAERKNRIILDRARSMLKSKRLPKEFWAEAVAYESRAKLDDKSEKFIFIGYDNNSKGYKLYNPNNEKILISRDVVFNEEGECDFGSGVDDFNFFPIEENDNTQINQVSEQQEPATPPISPALTTCGDSPPSFLNERTEERTRSLQDLYEVTERHDNLTLFCLFADCEPVNFQEAALDEKWRIAMDEEIKAIMKNDTWELTTLPKEKAGDILIVCLYVDDLIFTGSDPSLFEEFKRVMIKEFEMTDIGLMAYYLGIEVKQKEEGIFISQESYAKEILKKFKMNDCKPISTPVECGVKLSKHNEGTTNFGLLYSFSNDYKLVGYSDNDWDGDVDDRKSTTRFVFFMGDTAFTWMSKKQPIVTLSTCEAEYVAATSSVCHAIWLRNLLKELSLPQEEPSEICVDNKSTIALSKNPVFHDRSKHIDTRYHFIRECIARKEVQIKYVKSQDQAADIFTKPLNQEDFVRFRSLLGVTGSSLRGGVGS